MPEKRKSKKRTNQNIDNSRNNIIKSVLLSAILSVAVFFLMMIVFSVLITKREISGVITKILPFVCCAVSGFIGGLIIASSVKKRTLLFCAASSLAQSLIICAVLFATVGNIGLKTLLAGVVIFLFSAVGAILKLNKKPKRKI